MIKVNAMGDACPIPVIKTKNAIREMNGAGQVEVLVDNEIAVQNLTKMAKQKGYQCQSEKISDDEYKVMITVPPSQLNRTLTSSYPQPGLPASTIDGKPYSWGTWLSPIWFAELGGDNKLKVSEINISEKFTYNINKHLDVVANLGYNSGVASRDIKKMAITSYNYCSAEDK